MTIKSITIKLDENLLADVNKAISFFNKKNEKEYQNIYSVTKSSIIRIALTRLVRKYKKLNDRSL